LILTKVGHTTFVLYTVDIICSYSSLASNGLLLDVF